MYASQHSATSAAPIEEVFKLLHDPTRVPEWWSGVAEVSGLSRHGSEYRFTRHGAEVADLILRPEGGRTVLSCASTGLEWIWSLAPSDDGKGTEIHVELVAPEEQRELGERQEPGDRGLGRAAGRGRPARGQRHLIFRLR